MSFAKKKISERETDAVNVVEPQKPFVENKSNRKAYCKIYINCEKETECTVLLSTKYGIGVVSRVQSYHAWLGIVFARFLIS